MQETRINYDRRTLRKKHAPSFVHAINLQKQQLSTLIDADQGMPAHLTDPNLRVLVRKRPQLHLDADDFDVVTATSKGVVIHDCRMHPIHKQPYIATYYARLEAHGEAATEQDVCSAIHLEELIANAAGGCSTSALCMFGQTGSGKTHSMAAVLDTLGALLFPGSSSSSTAETGSSSSSGGYGSVQLSCFDVCGKTCHDLLDGRRAVGAKEDISGHTQVLARSVAISSAAEFAAALSRAQEVQAAHVPTGTSRNSESSRSHTLYQLTFHPPAAAPAAAAAAAMQRSNALAAAAAASAAGAEPGSECLSPVSAAAAAATAANMAAAATAAAAGRLLLVDLAGSEGLGVLKECFRVRTENTQLAAKQQQQPAPAAPPASGSSAGAAALCEGSTENSQNSANSSSSNEANGVKKRSSGGGGRKLVLPWRQSLLTRLLRGVLDPPPGFSGKAVVLATLSPCASDTEASLNTLRYAAIAAGCPIGSDADMLLSKQDVAILDEPQQQQQPAAEQLEQQQGKIHKDGGSNGGSDVKCMIEVVLPSKPLVAAEPAAADEGLAINTGWTQ